jgi:hypothetical protein
MTEYVCPVEPRTLICTICTELIGIPGLDGSRRPTPSGTGDRRS